MRRKGKMHLERLLKSKKYQDEIPALGGIFLNSIGFKRGAAILGVTLTSCCTVHDCVRANTPQDQLRVSASAFTWL